MVFGIWEMLNLIGMYVFPLFPLNLTHIIKQPNQIMPKGYMELWLFTVRRENLREDKTIFKYLKEILNFEGNIIRVRTREGRCRKADFDHYKANFLMTRTSEDKSVFCP